MKYILWQCARSPHSIAGTIEAPNIVVAANMARAMYGSFQITEWPRVSPAHKWIATDVELRADDAEQEAAIR